MPSRKAKPAPKRRALPREPKENQATHAGFHFAQLYQSCQWKWYIRFILGVEPKETPVPLAFGGAVHAGRAAFYRTKGDIEKARRAIRHYFADPQVHLEDESQAETLARRAETLLNAWAVAWGQKDLKRYEFLHIERYFEVPVPGLPGFIFTGRVDDVRRERSTGKTQIFDAKTSGYSETLTMDSFSYGDQATAYVWGVEEALGLKIDSVVPDIFYWSRNSQDPAKIRCIRPITVLRSPGDVEQFKLGIMQLYSEIAQKYAALKKGADPRALYSRNTHYCVAYGHLCEFADICRSKALARGEAPRSFFTQRPGKLDIKRISRTISDRMAGG